MISTPVFMILPLTGPLTVQELPSTPTLSPEFLAAVSSAALDRSGLSSVSLVERIERNLAACQDLRPEKRADFLKILRWIKVCCP